MKTNLLISFSGGETSAFMAQWLWRNKQDDYNMVFVFANTGDENEETLHFINNCSRHFGFKVHWIETRVFHGERKGSDYYELDFGSASRDGEPFEEIIKKYGIPNQSAPHCTRELKERPIRKFGNKYFDDEPYLTAIGIRNDEMDRMNAKKDSLGLIYPLVYQKPMNKKQINFYWDGMPFRLELKGYEGNCKTCWKKSDNKLFQIAKDNERKFFFFGKMEARYGNYIPLTRLQLMENRGEYPKLPIKFFRGNRSVEDIINGSKNFNGTIINDSEQYPEMELFDDMDGEKCEVFSSCKET